MGFPSEAICKVEGYFLHPVNGENLIWDLGRVRRIEP